MRILCISFSFLLYFTILPNFSYASYVIGGDITYSCTANPGEYNVELRTYIEDDGSISIFESINYSSASCGISESLNLLPVSTSDISQDCPAFFNVEERLFRGLLTLPIGCGTDWVLSYSTCCRNSSITSGAASQGFYLSANLDNTLTPCNNSPIFSTPNLIFACDNSPVIYSAGAIDSDRDSLAYSLIDCSQEQYNDVSYEVGFSGQQPLSTTSGFTIDEMTGEINFTPTPSLFQIAPVCVLVEEYRNGVKIGEIVRDIQIVSNLHTIPTLGQWGIITMILLLLIVGVAVFNSVQATELDNS